MKKIILTIGFILINLSFSQASTFHFMDAREHEQIILNKEIYSFFNHATRFWDKKTSAKKGIEKLFLFSKNNKIPVISTFDANALAYDKLMMKYYITPNMSDISVESWAGQHNIVFKNAKKIFIAGGNLSLCLCESIRDIVRGSESLYNSKKLNLYIVTDAVYDEKNEFNPIKKESLLRFARSYFYPSFRCPNQNHFDYPLPKIQNTTVRIYEEKIFIVKFRLIPPDLSSIYKSHKRINIHFIKSENLEKYL